jgi:1-deoxy-D-xylulose-5-phosphate synthase
VRYPRGSGSGAAVEEGLATLTVGKAETRRRGQRIALLAFGALVIPAVKVAETIGATAVNMRFVKPLDAALLLDLARSHEAFVTLEDNAIAGGAGSGVAELLAAHGISLPILHLGLADTYLEHASREELLAESGLDVAGIESAIRARFANLIPLAPMRSAG